MILRQKDLLRIKEGSITLAFRKWKRASVKKGSLIKTSIGRIEIQELDKVLLSHIVQNEAIQAGYNSLDDLLRALNRRSEGDIYKISVRYHSPDPRIELRNRHIETHDEFEAVQAKLDRLDHYSKRGPWTLSILELIEANPQTRAKDLASQIGVEKDWLKLNVRKLKNQGLTISHEVGYSLSPRGKTFLQMKRTGMSNG